MDGNNMDLIEGEAWNKNRKSSGRWMKPAALCTGLLVLILLIVVLILVARAPGVNNSSNTTQVQTSQDKCDNLTERWLHLQTSYNTLSENTIQLQNKFYTLDKEKDALKAERDVTKVDIDTLRVQLDVLGPDRDNLRSERDSLRNETDALRAQRNSLATDEELLRLERDALKPERDGLREERDKLKSENDALVAERDDLRAEQEVLKPERDSLKDVLGALTIDQAELQAEKDRLMENNSSLTLKMEGLQKKYNTLLESTKLTVNASDKVCPHSWIVYRNTCYYISKQNDHTGWIFAKRQCEDRKGHLVIINSKEENDFVSRFYDQTWIGLSDSEENGKLKWVNGVDLVDDIFWMKGEPKSASSKEKCVAVTRGRGEWNALPCRSMLSYVCEM